MRAVCLYLLQKLERLLLSASGESVLSTLCMPEEAETTSVAACIAV